MTPTISNETASHRHLPRMWLCSNSTGQTSSVGRSRDQCRFWFVRQNVVAVQAEEILAVFAKFSQVIRPRRGIGACEALPLGDKGFDQFQKRMAVGVGVENRIQKGNHTLQAHGE